VTNHERVGRALELLKAGLGPSVERELRNTRKSTPSMAGASAPPGRSVGVTDACFEAAGGLLRDRVAGYSVTGLA
jgi:hypothetical protein